MAEAGWLAARGRPGPGNLGLWLAGVVVVGLIALSGGADAATTVPVGDGEVVEQDAIEGVPYQIRRTAPGSFQGWVMLEGQWSHLDQAAGSSLDVVRAAVEAFVGWLHSGHANPSVNALQAELHDAGVTHFSAVELLRIRRPEIAGPLGFAGLTFEASPTERKNLVGVAKIAEQLRKRYGGPVRVLNGLRPEPYNTAVKGSENSKHPDGRALDLAADDMPRLRAVALAMYEEGLINGLILYAGDIHIDTRIGARHLDKGKYA